jgi:hypothetical protein
MDAVIKGVVVPALTGLAIFLAASLPSCSLSLKAGRELL